MAREQKAGKKRKAPNASKVDQSLPEVLDPEACLSGGKRHKLGASEPVHGGQTLVEGPSAKRPPPILQWLQPSQEGDAGKISGAEGGGEKRVSVEQYVQRWGTSSHQGKDNSGGGEMRGAEKASSSTGGEGVEEALRAASAGVSEICAGQEALSISTAGSMTTEEGLLGGPPGPDVGQEVNPLSPNTVYAHQLDLVKQAMCKEQGVPGSACDPQALNVYIAAKLEQLRQKAQGSLGVGGGSREGIPEERPPCGDHSAELLARIVVEVRKVVLGAAPLKGSILEQIAEAAFSNKGVAVSPCEMCGQAASADMAQILSISLGQTHENADMRIGHAAVALLNARQQLPGGRGSSPDVAGGAVDNGSGMLRPGALAIPDCSWRGSTPPEGTSPASTLIHPPTPLSSRNPSFLPPPAPKFNASANFASLLPPLPSFNSSVLAAPPSPMYQAAAGGSPGLPRQAPVWRHDYQNVVEGVFAADGSLYNLAAPQPDLLDVVEGPIPWPAKSVAMASSPALRPCSSIEKPRAHMVNEAELIAHPIPNWGQMSLLLGSKARAREVAVSPGGGLLDLGLQKGVPPPEAEAPSLKRSHGSLDNLFAADGPAAERQLSAVELTIKGYLEEDNDRELCATNAVAFQVSNSIPLAADDELNMMEEPLGTAPEWDFLRADFSAAPGPAEWPEDNELSISATLARQGALNVSNTLPAADVPTEDCGGPPDFSKGAVLTACEPPKLSEPPALCLSDKDTPIGKLRAQGDEDTPIGELRAGGDEDTPIGELRTEGVFTKGARVRKILKGLLAAQSEDAGAQRATAGGGARGKQGLVFESDSSQGDKSGLDTQGLETGHGSWATPVDSLPDLPEGSLNQQIGGQVKAAPVDIGQPKELRSLTELYGTEGGPQQVSLAGEGIKKRSKRPSRAVCCPEKQKGVLKRQKKQKAQGRARIEASEVIDLRGL